MDGPDRTRGRSEGVADGVLRVGAQGQPRTRDLPDARRRVSSSDGSASARSASATSSARCWPASSSASSTSRWIRSSRWCSSTCSCSRPATRSGRSSSAGLKKNAGPQVALTVVLCVTSLVTTVTAAKIMGYDSGTAAGLMAGAFTESTVIGTAGADHRAARPAGGGEAAPAEQHPGGLRGELPGGHGVRRVVPLEPRAAAAQGEPEGREPEARSGDDRRDAARAPAGSRPTANGTCARSASAEQRRGGPKRRRSRAVVRPGAGVRRARSGRAAPSSMPEPDTVLRPGDIVVVGARRHVMLPGAASLGTEVEDRELLDFPVGRRWTSC